MGANNIQSFLRNIKLVLGNYMARVKQTFAKQVYSRGRI